MAEIAGLGGKLKRSSKVVCVVVAVLVFLSTDTPDAALEVQQHTVDYNSGTFPDG